MSKFIIRLSTPTEAQWYRQAVIDAIPLERRLTCMEHVLHEPWKARAAPRCSGGHLGPSLTLPFSYLQPNLVLRVRDRDPFLAAGRV